MFVARAVERLPRPAPRVPGVDDLVEEVGRLGAFAAFDAVEGEFVDDHEVETRPAADAAGQALLGQRLAQVFQQAGAGRVPHAVSQLAETLRQRPLSLDWKSRTRIAFPVPIPTSPATTFSRPRTTRAVRSKSILSTVSSDVW
jgi:hypothetical protein